jgi:crotonobetainyl-CoA:carnitine CoA-transferase CaiB-like acyl-CoA transferase
MDHPIAGPVRQTRPLGDFEGTPTEIRRGAPGYGEHTREIAAEAGLDPDSVEALLRDGVLVST